jgi:hypothetical protein
MRTNKPGYLSHSAAAERSFPHLYDVLIFNTMVFKSTLYEHFTHRIMGHRPFVILWEGRRNAIQTLLSGG